MWCLVYDAILINTKKVNLFFSFCIFSIFYFFIFSFLWHWRHLNVNLVCLCSSKNAMTISFNIIGFVVSGQTRSSALFSKIGLSSPIPWHRSVEGCPQSLHGNFFIYDLVKVAWTKFVNTQSEKPRMMDSCVVSMIVICHLSPFLIFLILMSMFSLWGFRAVSVIVLVV